MREREKEEEKDRGRKKREVEKLLISEKWRKAGRGDEEKDEGWRVCGLMKRCIEGCRETEQFKD